MDRLLAMQVFARVVELGSFSLAARGLGLSRARVSEVVQELEEFLGAPLLFRTTRRVSLTDDGREYLARVQRILADVAEAEGEVQASRARARGVLRAGTPFALARLFLLPRLPQLLRDHPELGLELVLENHNIELLREGLDCAITYGAPTNTDLVARRLATTHLVTCAAPSYLERHGEPRTPQALERHSGIAFLARVGADNERWQFVRDGAKLLQRVPSRLSFNSMEACVEAAEAGLGVTQVLSSVATVAIRKRRLQPILLDYASPGPELFLAYPPNRHASARLKAFADFAIRSFSSIDQDWSELVRKFGKKRSRGLGSGGG